MNSPSDEVALIPCGKLMLARSPLLPKGAMECLYNDASIAIQQTSNNFYYQLCVTRAYQEGELNLLPSGDEAEDDEVDNLGSNGANDEKTFLLSEELQIWLRTSNDGTHVLVWNDLSGDEGDKLEFHVDEAIKFVEVDHFMLMLYKCLYETKYQRKADEDATMADLREFEYDPRTEAHPKSSFDELKSLHSPVTNDVDEPAHTAPVVDTQPDSKEPTDPSVLFKDHEPIEGEATYLSAVELRFFESSSERFQLLSTSVEVAVVKAKNGYFLASTDLKFGFKVPIAQQMNPTFNDEMVVMIFNVYHTSEATSAVFSLLLRFPQLDALNDFRTKFYTALYESMIGTLSSDSADVDYVLKAFGKMDIDDETLEEYFDADDGSDSDVSDGERIEKIVNDSVKLKSKRADLFVSEDSDDEYGDNEAVMEESAFFKGKQKNNSLTVGLANDRSYVTRGNKVGVFKNDLDSMAFVTTLEGLKDSLGHIFVPEKSMLHQRDNALLLTSKNVDDSNIYKVDLTRGQVVELWDADDKEKLKNFSAISKFAPLTDEQQLTGISDNSIFRIDPRLSGKKIVTDHSFKAYKTKNNKFETLAVTDSGYTAVGLATGNIRLYKKLGQNAVTSLPAIGEPFTGIDVTKDGLWILATCKNSLILIHNRIGRGQRNAGFLGFEKSFDADKKPTPKRLALLPAHVSYILNATGSSQLSFTVARFDTSINQKETSIITSTGPFTIIWSLSNIAKNWKRTPTYRIFGVGQTVVAENFVFNSQSNVITALEDGVVLMDKLKFQKPVRANFEGEP